MTEMNNKQLIEINGGALNAAFLNAAARLFSTILDLGQTLGSAIRRAINGKYCKI